MDKKHSPDYIKALEYHEKGQPGKIALKPTKHLLTQHDLSLAYSPGVQHLVLKLRIIQMIYINILHVVIR